MNFEVKIKKLEEIVKKMENGDITLDESLKMFEEGVGLTRECQKELNEAEQKVQLLMGVDSNGKPELKDF